jgi:hypothetical protein
MFLRDLKGELCDSAVEEDMTKPAVELLWIILHGIADQAYLKTGYFRTKRTGKW